MAWSGTTITENDAINFHRYYDAPKNIINSLSLVGTGHFMMSSIFTNLY
jgi:hypothetical protein